jgi:hypothetical protein
MSTTTTATEEGTMTTKSTENRKQFAEFDRIAYLVNGVERELPGWKVELTVFESRVVVSITRGKCFMFSGTVDEARSYMFGLTDACRARDKETPADRCNRVCGTTDCKGDCHERAS